MKGSSPDRINRFDETEQILQADHNSALLNEIRREAGWSERTYNAALATKWHSARAICCLINVRNFCRSSYLKKVGVDEEMVPWIPHPWHIIDEEELFQTNQLRGIVQLIKDKQFMVQRAPKIVYP